MLKPIQSSLSVHSQERGLSGDFFLTSLLWASDTSTKEDADTEAVDLIAELIAEALAETVGAA